MQTGDERYAWEFQFFPCLKPYGNTLHRHIILSFRDLIPASGQTLHAAFPLFECI